MDRAAHEAMVETWVAAFGAALNRRDIDRVLDLFEPDGFWRDLSALTWNECLYGRRSRRDPHHAFGMSSRDRAARLED
jgi:hypothetical protein